MWRWARASRPTVVEAPPHEWRHDWPVRLRGRAPGGAAVELRPLVAADEWAYVEVRRANVEWLAPWDATAPRPSRGARTFPELVEHLDSEARAGRQLPFALVVDGLLVGQLNVSNIVRGSFWSCAMGYWIAQSSAGRGVTPTAVALAGDHCLFELGLHRIEINIRPENAPSLAVVRKLGFRDEGLRPRYLHIDGDWRDHRSFALTTEDLAGETLMARLTQSSQQSLWRHTDSAPQP